MRTAAAALGVSRSALYRRLERHGLGAGDGAGRRMRIPVWRRIRGCMLISGALPSVIALVLIWVSPGRGPAVAGRCAGR